MSEPCRITSSTAPFDPAATEVFTAAQERYYLARSGS